MHAALPVAQFFFAVGVVERKHGDGMPGLDESFTRLAADALGGRVGSDEFGMLGLELFELVHQLVEVGVGEFGIIEDVIEIFVMTDFFAQRIRSFCRGRKGMTEEIIVRGSSGRSWLWQYRSFCTVGEGATGQAGETLAATEIAIVVLLFLFFRLRLRLVPTLDGGFLPPSNNSFSTVALLRSSMREA